MGRCENAKMWAENVTQGSTTGKTGSSIYLFTYSPVLEPIRAQVQNVINFIAINTTQNHINVMVNSVTNKYRYIIKLKRK